MNMPAGGGGQPMEHDMSSMPGMSMDGQMAGHGAGGTSLAPGNAPAPAAPSDHYADRIYQNGAMVDSRSMLHNEHGASRLEEHTSELQSLMRSSYAVFCLKKK